MTSSSPKAALLVGVNDYAAYDASLANALGTSNLRGALADVKCWYVNARRLGIPAENIEVRTSPLLTAADMPIDATGTRFGPATHDAILDGVQALGARLGSGGLAQGLLTWSGHGASGADGALLCPSDVTGTTLENAISYTKLAAALDAHVPAHALTIVLDTCHAAPSRFGGRLLPQPTRFLGAPGTAAATPKVRSQDRVLAACGAGGTSQEYHFQGVWHGAFTWAATTVLERWPGNESEGAHYISIDYAELLTRTAAVLQGAAFSQVPRWSGPEGDAAVPFGYPSSAAGAPESEQANGGPLQEIDPGQQLGIYILKNLQGTSTLGYVVAAAVDQNGWKAGNEYWVWQNTSARFPTSGWTLAPFTGALPGWAIPANAITFESNTFPSTTGQVTPQLGGPWFAINVPPTTTSIGWLNPNPTNGAPTSTTWYEVAAGSAPPYIATVGGPLLRFAQVTLPGTLYNVSVVTDPLSTNP
jgi:hypothetical protein